MDIKKTRLMISIAIAIAIPNSISPCFLFFAMPYEPFPATTE